MSTKRKLYIPGKGELALTDADHVATGGEGSVYIKKGMAIKLFLDAAKARQAGMEEKIGLLSTIRHPFIVAPEGPVFDAKQEMVGYVMPLAKGVPLVKTFTNSWRDQNAFDQAMSAKLVENMRLGVSAAHGLGALLVDGNEFNYHADGSTPQFIDVDSWQIGRFKATALMPSIRDYSRSDFSTDTDWFAWAIVSFQVFSGIHPFKGTHPDFKKGDVEARMRANASVYDSRVKLNSAVRDLATIPGALSDWYEGVFQRGERSAPPSAFLSQAAPGLTRKLRVVTTGNGLVRHDRIAGLPYEIRHVSGNGIAYFQDGNFWKAYDVQRKQSISALGSAQIEALFNNKAALVRHLNQFVFVEMSRDELEGQVLAGDSEPQPKNTSAGKLTCSADKLVVMGNRIFALNPNNENGMTELSVDTLGNRVLLSVKAVWPVTVQSTRFLDGVGVLDALGKPFLVVPEGAAITIQRAPALADYRVVAGFSRGPQMVLLHAYSRNDGKLYRLRLSEGKGLFNLDDATVTDDVDMNVALTARGMLVSIYDEGEVTVSSVQNGNTKVVQDSSVTKDMMLFALPDGVYYHKGADVFRLSLV